MTQHQIRVLLGTMLLSTTACAEIYKCTTESGTVFSERPCAEDAEIVKIRDKRPELSESEMKAHRERQQEKARTYFNGRKVQSLLKKVSNLQQRIEQNEVRTRQTIQRSDKRSELNVIQLQHKNAQFKQQTQAKIDKLNAEIDSLSDSEN